MLKSPRVREHGYGETMQGYDLAGEQLTTIAFVLGSKRSSQSKKLV
jgi:hypothetical protein